MKKLSFLALFAAFGAQAVNVSVTVNNCGGLGPADCNSLRDQIKEDINEDLPDVSIDKYADGISDATGFAQKGQTSEYGRDFDLFVIRGGAGVAVKGEIDDMESAEGIGIGGTVGAMINMDILPIAKLGFIDFSKLDLGFSFMSYQMDQEVDAATFDGKIAAFNIMARYRLVDGVDIVSGNLVRWGGVHLHTGFQRSSMKLDLVQDFKDEKVEESGNSATFQNGKASFGIDSQVSAIPVEISTSIRLAYAFSLYAGLGFDIVSGSTDIDFDASGNIVGDGGAAAGFDADIAANEGGDGTPMGTNKRVFGGLQINVPLVSIFAHVNKGLGDDLLGVNAGLKVYW